MVAVIIAREVGVTSLRIAAASNGIIMESSRLAKYKTAFQLVAVVALLIHYTYAGINFHLVGMTVLWIALFCYPLVGHCIFIRFFKKTLSPSRVAVMCTTQTACSCSTSTHLRYERLLCVANAML